MPADTHSADQVYKTHGAAEAAALDALTEYLHQAGSDGLVGVMVLSIQPDATLLRLRAEQTQELYAATFGLLHDNLRASDRALRTNSFEWTILLPSLPSPAALTLAMLRLARAFERLPGEVLRIVTQIDVRCGGALHPETEGDAQHLLQSARIACLEAQRADNHYILYSPDMETRAHAQTALMQEASAALSAGGFSLYLQPQVHLANGQCIGAEALLRWRRANGDWVPPPTLLGVIELGGLRQTFNRWIFHRAMQMAQSLSSVGIEIPLSINLSADDLQDRDLARLLDQAMRTFAIAPTRIRLEVTETALVQHTEAAQLLIEELLKLGVSLSIDDFGTGYSGMTHLRTMPVQEIKIDQMFIRTLSDSAVDRKIVRAIIELGHHMEISVLAEGVETLEAAHILNDMGCESAQGFLYAKAMPLQEFIAWHAGQLSATNS